MPSLDGRAAHEAFMARAVDLARRGRARTAPNPCVGSVLVRDGVIVAEGWHRACGGPHAERECLADARAKNVDPFGCDLYVTLEPCNHHGRTPPCTDAVLEAGVRRVLIGAMDPNELAAGGAARLRDNGVEVVTGVLERECLDLLSDFLVWQRTDRCHVTLKLASTLDGRIAARSGKPEPVSSPASFADVQRLRSECQAVIVGGGTFRVDDPSLTCRLENLPTDHEQPLAVVVTTRLPGAGENCTLLRKRADHTIFWTAESAASSSRAAALSNLGVRVWGLPEGPDGLDLGPAFTRLRNECGVHRALCEGGGGLAMRLVRQGLVDEFVLYLAPRILGDERAPAGFSGNVAETMADAVPFRLSRRDASGADLRLVYMPD